MPEWRIHVFLLPPYLWLSSFDLIGLQLVGKRRKEG